MEGSSVLIAVVTGNIQDVVPWDMYSVNFIGDIQHLPKTLPLLRMNFNSVAS